MLKTMVLSSILIALLLTPNLALAANAEEVWVEEAKLVSGEKLLLVPGRTAELEQGQKVEILIILSKLPSARGVISISSDLVQPEGLLKFRVEDYPQSQVLAKLSGSVPDALVRESNLARLGERPFTLVNVIYDRDGIVRTLFSANAISTTVELKRSRTKISELQKVLSESSNNDERSTLARELLKAASIAQEQGSPRLGIMLCELAEDVIELKLTIVPLPIWYWLALVILFAALSGTVLVLVNQGKKKQTSWIKAR